jgi:hypothetical protein
MAQAAFRDVACDELSFAISEAKASCALHGDAVRVYCADLRCVRCEMLAFDPSARRGSGSGSGSSSSVKPPAPRAQPGEQASKQVREQAREQQQGSSQQKGEDEAQLLQEQDEPNTALPPPEGEGEGEGEAGTDTATRGAENHAEEESEGKDNAGSKVPKLPGRRRGTATQQGQDTAPLRKSAAGAGASFKRSKAACPDDASATATATASATCRAAVQSCSFAPAPILVAHRGQRGDTPRKSARGSTALAGSLAAKHAELILAAEMEALLAFAKHGNVRQAATVLARTKLDVNVSCGGHTMLHVAAAHGQVDLIKFLLSRGADREARDASGLTPLQLARLREQGPTVRLLLAERR